MFIIKKHFPINLGKCFFNVVPKAGVEPARPCERLILSQVRLPIPPLRHALKEKLSFFSTRGILQYFYTLCQVLFNPRRCKSISPKSPPKLEVIICGQLIAKLTALAKGGGKITIDKTSHVPKTSIKVLPKAAIITIEYLLYLSIMLNNTTYKLLPNATTNINGAIGNLPCKKAIIGVTHEIIIAVFRLTDFTAINKVAFTNEPIIKIKINGGNGSNKGND